VDLKPSSAVLRLFAPLAVSRVKASVAANLEKLKQVLETRDDPAMTSDEKVT
jgi:hypothetical protein